MTETMQSPPLRRVALVTGAGSGIGRASAIALAAEGYAVVLAGRRQSPLEETAGLLGGADHIVVPTDVGDPEAVGTLFQAIRTAYGRIDVLFNNAGMGGPPVPFEDLSFEEWRRVVDVNLHGAFLCAQGAMRLMKEQSRAAAASSTTVRSLPMPRDRTVRRTRRRSTRSQDSRAHWRWTDGGSV